MLRLQKPEPWRRLDRRRRRAAVPANMPGPIAMVMVLVGGRALQEAAARGNGGAGEIHLGKLGKMRTANAVTHDGPPRSADGW